MVRINIRLHPPRVHSFAFFEVDNVQFNFLLTTILNRKVVPLRMSSRIGVASHKQIILIFTHFYTCVQITALKITVKNKLLSLWYCRVHSLKYPCCFGLEVWVEFSKISGHMKVIWVYNTFVKMNLTFVFEIVLPFYFLM